MAQPTTVTADRPTVTTRDALLDRIERLREKQVAWKVPHALIEEERETLVREARKLPPNIETDEYRSRVQD